MSDTFEFTLKSPLTQEQIDLITDVEMEHTDKVFFKTPKGKEVVFVKERTGEWIWVQYDANPEIGNFHCSECNFIPACFNLAKRHLNYCPNCGARMKGEIK